MSVWEENYRGGRFNRYPYDLVVSAVLRRFGSASDRTQVSFLDLGCGGGNNSKFLVDEGFQVHAVDGSPSSVELTKSFAGLDSERAVQADFRELPFAPETFDCVIDRQSFGHNPTESLPKIVSEVTRVLKPGGVFISVVFSHFHPRRYLGKISDSGGSDSFAPGSGFEKSGYVHFFGIDEIKQLFASFEFEEFALKESRSLIGDDRNLHNDSHYFFVVKKV